MPALGFVPPKGESCGVQRETDRVCVCVLGRSSEVSKSNLDLRDEGKAEEE